MATATQFEHVTDGCFAESIGAAGVSRAEFAPILAETAPAQAGA